MAYRYRFTEQQFFHEDIGGYTAYGIELEGKPGAEIQDVSTEKAFVSELVRKMNQYQLDPIHLSDVIEDALAG